MICLGDVAQFQSLPARLELMGGIYFLTRQDGQMALLSAVCPHQGGEVECAAEDEPGFECPVHGWRFNLHGHGLNVASRDLSQIPLTVRDGRIYVEPQDLPGQRKKGRLPLPSDDDGTTPEVELTLHAHACVEMRLGKFSLLTDPWLDGPAFLGAWTQYPPPQVAASDLQPSAILITHEHSDHLHPETLQAFERTTPIWFPDFPNRRIGKMLATLGFEHLHPMRFGHPYEVGPKVTVTAYEPASTWNDSLMLIDLDGLHVLNQNDAGMNHRIAELLPKIDVLMSQFSHGASSFPATWGHLDDDAKAQIYRKSSQGVLMMLQKSAQLYGARYVLPCASHFALWHPLHRAFDAALGVNSLADVRRQLKDSDSILLDLLPGDSWNSRGQRFTRPGTRKERRQLWRRSGVDEYLEQTYNEATFRRFYPVDVSTTPSRVHDYLLSLNGVPEMQFCEDLGVRLVVLESHNSDTLRFTVDFTVDDGQLAIAEHLDDEQIRLKIWIPQQVLGRIVDDNLSWDEAHIGYWCRFERQPDVFNPGFWRLLQAPYLRRQISPATASGAKGESAHKTVSETTPIQQLIEGHEQAHRILGRYGLYCLACGKGHRETLRDGAKAHGLRDSDLDRMVAELNSVLN